jgi:hypothetical protein
MTIRPIYVFPSNMNIVIGSMSVPVLMPKSLVNRRSSLAFALATSTVVITPACAGLTARPGAMARSTTEHHTAMKVI